MKQELCSVEVVARRIEAGEKLLLAGDEKLLSALPRGNWIGGTIPYFMSPEGGIQTEDRIFVTPLPDFVENASIRYYDEVSIRSVYEDAPENGFSVIIIPSASKTHLEFALNSPRFPHFATRVLVGWVSGVLLDNLGKIKPKVFGDAMGGREEGAMVMHVSLPASHVANIEIINIFEQFNGDSIQFVADGFSAKEAIINGTLCNFYEYVKEKKLETQFPLVANYFETMINVSFQSLDEQNQEVKFYAPVFKGIEYKHAKPVQDYVSDFRSRIPTDAGEKIVFSCNCILNYLYSKLEGKKTGNITGPMTFGEVAYLLLNQTLVYLTIDDVS